MPKTWKSMGDALIQKQRENKQVILTPPHIMENRVDEDLENGMETKGVINITTTSLIMLLDSFYKYCLGYLKKHLNMILALRLI